MTFCSVCGRAQGKVLLWRLAAEAAEDLDCKTQDLSSSTTRLSDSYQRHDTGRLVYEQGLSPCCSWAQADGLKDRLKRRIAKTEPKENYDILQGARLLLKPGAGLDRSYLDGLGKTPWISSPSMDLLGKKCQLSARIIHGPVAPAVLENGQTTASVDLQLQCKVGEVTRMISFSVPVPAPVDGYISVVHKKHGVRLCVNLRTTPKINEVQIRSIGTFTEASILLGPTCAAESGWQPRMLRLRVQWKQNEASSATMHAAKDPESQGIPLAHVLRALLSFTEVLQAETLQQILTLMLAHVRRRTPMTFTPAGVLRREEIMCTQAASFLLLELTTVPSEEQWKRAESIANMLLRVENAPCADDPVALLEALLLETCNAEEDHWRRADALDCLARMLCACFSSHLAIGIKDPAEQSRDTLAPCTVSAQVARKAIEDTLLCISREVALEVKNSQQLQTKPSCGVKWKEGVPEVKSTRRTLVLKWNADEAQCPLCGEEGHDRCRVCAQEIDAEIAACHNAEEVSPEPAGFHIARGMTFWTLAPRASQLNAVAWAAKEQNDVALNALLRCFTAAEFIHALPVSFVKRLRGAGVKANLNGERSNAPVARTPCLISEDPTLHDATLVTTGIRSSQVHSAWTQRRACKRKRGSMCLYMLNEKTTQQTRAIPPGILFAPSTLQDEEDERAVVESAQAAVCKVRALATKSSGDCVQVLIEGRRLSRQVAKWIKARPQLRCPGDDLASAPEVLLNLEQASRLPLLLREELNARLGDFRAGEEVAVEHRRARVMRRVSVRLGGCSFTDDRYTIGRRLPRVGDIINEQVVSSIDAIQVHMDEDFAMVPLSLLRKLPERDGDAASLSPLAYVNAVFAERQGHVNVRLNPGHTVILVQRKPVEKIQHAEGPAALLLLQLQRGELGLCHVDGIAAEEHCLMEDQAHRKPVPPYAYTLPLGELQLHCARALALPPPPGHPVRQGPILRALLACCGAWRGLREGAHAGSSATLVGESTWGAAAPESAARAHVALFSVMLLDEVDGTSYEDAGSTDLTFGIQQGRCFFMSTRLNPKSRRGALVVTRDKVELKSPKPETRHLDASGRARGFVLKGAAHAYLKDGSAFRAPFDAWVESWGTTRRGTPSVLLLQEHGWQSGIKVVGMLQKSVLTAVANGLFAPVPTSFLRSEASCVSRNAPATYVSSLALRLLLARGLRLKSRGSRARLPRTSAIFLEQDCCLWRIQAARELAWGLCRDDRYPVLAQAHGARVGTAHVLLQEMGIPLDKAALHVLTPHIGGRQRKGFRRSQGQSLEVMEIEMTKTPGKRSFDATRSVEDQETPRREVLEAWRAALALFNCGIYRELQNGAESKDF